MTAAAVRAAFHAQARACAELGSPFMARLCALLGDRLAPGDPVSDRVLDWPVDPLIADDALALRLCGGLHALARAGRAGLEAVYPPHAADDAALWSAVARALRREAAFLAEWLDRPPQTNDLRRAAVLIAAARWLLRRHPLPLVLSELGASAGLNLAFDAYALAGDARPGALTLAPVWRGLPPPPEAALTVADRRGCDLGPPDRAALLAYLWPDQPDRRALTDAALALPAPAVDRADAADWIAARLARPRPGMLHLVYHTVAWQYFPPATRARTAAALRAAGARATADAPLAWFGMESEGPAAPPGAALTLRLWPGGQTLDLGRADFHGRWIDWRAPA